MSTFPLRIGTPDGLLFEGNVERVICIHQQDHLPGRRCFCHCLQRQQHEVYVQALFSDDHQLR